MSKVIENRYEFVYLFDVENGNPNGDPDAGNMPRIDPETSHGIVTDVCLKRKVRNFVEIAKSGAEAYNIYVKEKAVLSTSRAGAYLTPEVKEKKKDGDRIEAARDWMCANFFDVRTFGAVMSTTNNNCGQVRGAVQMNFGRSLDPICQLDITITRMAVETEKEAESQKGDNRTMGRKHIVPYGLYRAEGYVSAFLAQKTGFTEDDLELFWQALANMFDHDHSAARGKMNARRLIVFKHGSGLGNAPAHKLFSLVTAAKQDDQPPRAYEQYKIDINKGACPEGVEIIEKL
jgi:CRISPR-associated protein Csd2